MECKNFIYGFKYLLQIEKKFEKLIFLRVSSLHFKVTTPSTSPISNMKGNAINN